MGKFIRISMVLMVLLAFVFSALSTPLLANSLWKEDSSSLYSAKKVFKQGDIVTILILESSTALSQAGTNTGLMDDLSLRFTNATNTGTSPRNEFALRGENKYAGTGKTSRTNNIQAKVAAVITKVMSNGNLALSGKHVVTVNDERQEINVTGVIRPQDISSANTVYSYQVAQAEISVVGEGTIAEAENPGWLTRMINWLF